MERIPTGGRVGSLLERFLDRSGVVNLRSISSASTLERQRRKYEGCNPASPFHVGQQMDVFIEAPAKAKIIANKSGGDVLKPLAHSSYQ